MADRLPVVGAVRRTARCHWRWLLRGAGAAVKGVFDALADGIFLELRDEIVAVPGG
jgi:hypothetical protein